MNEWNPLPITSFTASAPSNSDHGMAMTRETLPDPRPNRHERRRRAALARKKRKAAKR